MRDEEIYSERFTKGSKTYFFDIKKTRKGNLYLKVTESRSTGNGFEHHRLLVFEEDVAVFSKVLQSAAGKLQKLTKPE
jgi:hypothetical protein